MPAPKKIEISHRTVVFTVGVILGLWLLYQLRPIILLIFVGVILMAAFNPWVDRLEKLRVPRGVAIGVIYVLVMGLLVGTVAGLVPPLVEQTTKLVTRLPGYLSELGVVGFDQQVLARQLSALGNLPENILRLTVGVFSNLVGLFTLLIVTFYLLLERRNLDDYLVVLFGDGNEKKAAALVDEIEAKLGGWVRGELALMTIVGVLTYVGLRLLAIDFALPLALLAGILEVIPNLGPVIAAIPGVLLGLSISPVTGLAVGAMYFLVQQLENSVIVPKVMQRSVGLNPLVTIVVLIVGYQLAGLAGAVLAVPVTLLAIVVLSHVLGDSRLRKVIS